MTRFLSIVFSVFIADQFSKFVILQKLTQQESIPVIANVFHLTLVHNTGIAFGLFRDAEALLLLLISVSLFVLFYFGLRFRNTPYVWSIGSILGGALGNWVDRIRFGAVVDFLDFRFWPVFNVADSAITVGVVLYLWIYLKESKRKE